MVEKTNLAAIIDLKVPVQESPKLSGFLFYKQTATFQPLLFPWRILNNTKVSHKLNLTSTVTPALPVDTVINF